MQRHDLYHDAAGLRTAIIELEAAAAIPMHRHSIATEWLQCERGTLLLGLGEPDAHRVTLSAGAHHCIAPGQTHALENASAQPAAFLLVQSGHHDFLSLVTEQQRYSARPEAGTSK